MKRIVAESNPQADGRPSARPSDWIVQPAIEYSQSIKAADAPRREQSPIVSATKTFNSPIERGEGS